MSKEKEDKERLVCCKAVEKFQATRGIADPYVGTVMDMSQRRNKFITLDKEEIGREVSEFLSAPDVVEAIEAGYSDEQASADADLIRKYEGQTHWSLMDQVDHYKAIKGLVNSRVGRIGGLVVADVAAAYDRQADLQERLNKAFPDIRLNSYRTDSLGDEINETVKDLEVEIAADEENQKKYEQFLQAGKQKAEPKDVSRETEQERTVRLGRDTTRRHLKETVRFINDRITYLESQIVHLNEVKKAIES